MSSTPLPRVPSWNSPLLKIQEIQGDIGLDTIPSEDVPNLEDGMPENIDYNNLWFSPHHSTLLYVAWSVTAKCS